MRERERERKRERDRERAWFVSVVVTMKVMMVTI